MIDNYSDIPDVDILEKYLKGDDLRMYVEALREQTRIIQPRLDRLRDMENPVDSDGIDLTTILVY